MIFFCGIGEEVFFGRRSTASSLPPGDGSMEENNSSWNGVCVVLVFAGSELQGYRFLLASPFFD